MDIVEIIKRIVWLAIAAAIVLYALRFAGKAAGNAGV